MDEKRNFFRIRNSGSIKVKYGKTDLYLIDISPSGASVIATGTELMKEGVIEVIINHFSMTLNYKLLRKKGKHSILTFTMENQMNNLLAALKNLRSSTETPPPTSLYKPVTEHAIPTAKPKIENFLKLQSIYSMRLYQLMQQYHSEGHGSISLKDLRVLLGVDEFKSYKSYSTLKRKILEPSKKEINDKTDLTIIYSEIKEKNKISGVKFTIMSMVV